MKKKRLKEEEAAAEKKREEEAAEKKREEEAAEKKREEEDDILLDVSFLDDEMPPDDEIPPDGEMPPENVTPKKRKRDDESNTVTKKKRGRKAIPDFTVRDGKVRYKRKWITKDQLPKAARAMYEAFKKKQKK